MNASQRALARRLLTAGLAAITLTAGLPAVAHAAPVSGLSATLRNAVAAEASYEQKLAVASKFGLGDDLPLLERADYDFVIEIWKHVKDKPDLIEVRIAAEEAFGTSSTSADPQAANRACAEFIVSGAKAAYDRDIAREKRKADDKRLSDQARAAAAASIRVVADAELLRGTDAQFIGLIWELADEDPQWVNVKAAAKAARKGTPEEQKRFIASGMAAAAKEDVERRIREDDDKTAAEKAAELARAAKKHAADRIRLPVNEQLLNLPDRDFVTAVWNHAADGSEVHAAARSAARSADPAVWKAFIDTGIDQAVDRDIENALDAAEAEDRRRAQDILTRAEQALHRNLAKAARGALAGTADDVAAFLRKGQYDAYELDEAAALKAHKIRAFYDYSGSATRLFTFGKLGGPAASETQNWDSSAGNYDAARSKPVAGDFDGNGVQDIAAFYDYGNGHTKLFLFSDVDNGTGPRQVWDSGHGNWESARASYVAGDFDGDGRAEIGAFYDYGNAQTKLFVYDDVTGTPTARVVSDSKVGNWESARASYVAGDFDGDGRAEIGAFYDYGNAQTKLFVYDDVTGTPTARVVSDSKVGNWESARASYVAGDFDGDGRAEIGAFYDYGNAQTKLFLYDDVAGAPSARWTWDSKVGNWESGRASYVAGDFDGDGQGEIGAFYDYGNAQTKLFVFDDVTGKAAARTVWDSGRGNWDKTRTQLVSGS